MKQRQIRAANNLFHAHQASSPKPALLILKHPEIYTSLANFIRDYRLTTWHNSKNTRAEVIEAFRARYLPPIIAYAQKLKLSKPDITALSTLVQHLMDVMTEDAKHNTVWTTAYLVQLYQEKSWLNFLTHENYFMVMQDLNVHVFRFNQRKNDRQRRKDGGVRLSSSQLLREEFQTLTLEAQEFSDYTKNFISYMPRYCHIKQEMHSSLQMIFLFAVALVIIYGLSGNGVSLLLALLFPPCYIALEKLSNIKLLSRNPFSFGDMPVTTKTGLLSEIAKPLTIKKEAKKNPETKQPAHMMEETVFDDQPPSYPPPPDRSLRPKKSRAPRVTESEAMDEKEGIATILASAQLAPPIILVWETIQWGRITAQVGMTQKDIYPLWSGHFPQYGFYYVYFPEQELQQHEDQGMLNECKEVLAIGHVVPPTGHAGIVRESKDTLKIKMLSSGKSTQATGKPSEWRFSLFCLTHPQHLNAPPPRVGDHQYQLYAPNHLSKTH